jgi:putative Mg2+ transporter-C (MgtC) family protein
LARGPAFDRRRFLGRCTGIERQWRRRLAGPRTNTLVALGAATFLILFGARARRQQCNARRRSGGLRDRLYRDGPDLQGGLQCPRAQYGGEVWSACAQGAGFLAHAVLATTLIIFVNLGLRPIAGFMAQPTITAELINRYVVTVVNAVSRTRNGHARKV